MLRTDQIETLKRVAPKMNNGEYASPIRAAEILRAALDLFFSMEQKQQIKIISDSINAEPKSEMRG